MTPPPADPEFWKNIYGDEWEPASKAVIALHEKIIQKFPELEESVKFGHGATTGKKVKVPPGKNMRRILSIIMGLQMGNIDGYAEFKSLLLKKGKCHHKIYGF